MTDDLLAVTGLTRYFPVRRGAIVQQTVGHVRAVDGIDFTALENENVEKLRAVNSSIAGTAPVSSF